MYENELCCHELCRLYCSCGPDEHVAMVDKMQKSLKAANKVLILFNFCF